MKYLVLAALAALVVLAALLASPSELSDDRQVCRDLKELATAIDMVNKHNHRLRIRMPELRNDRDSNGMYHSMISVYGYLYKLNEDLGCR
jgi:hypothetical protein